MNHLRGLLRQEGIKLPAEVFHDDGVFDRLKRNKEVPDHLRPVVESYGRSIAELLRERSELDDQIKKYRNKDIMLLKSVPVISEVASKTIFAAVDKVKRFSSAKKLTSYSGLVPSVRSSG